MQVILYSKPDCPFCTKARNLLNMLGISYEQVTVGVAIESEEYKTNIWPTVPGIVVDGTIIGGYEELGHWAVNEYMAG